MYYTNIKDYEQLLAQHENDVPDIGDEFAKKSKPGTVIRAVKFILLASLLTLIINPVHAANDFYQSALFSPSDSLLKAEARGRIMIYDGIDIATIEKAMDEQFERIDNMMFIRILHPTSDDEFVAENDGC